jgi:hypothetical protein
VRERATLSDSVGFLRGPRSPPTLHYKSLNIVYGADNGLSWRPALNSIFYKWVPARLSEQDPVWRNYHRHRRSNPVEISWFFASLYVSEKCSNIHSCQCCSRRPWWYHNGKKVIARISAPTYHRLSTGKSVPYFLGVGWLVAGLSYLFYYTSPWH